MTNEEIAVKFENHENQIESLKHRMQDEFQNDKDYRTVLRILCLLDTMRNEKPAEGHFNEV